MTNTVDSVWKKVKKGGPEECWLWVGKYCAEAGYGRLDIKPEEGVYAHRAAYLSAYPGSIPLRAPADKTERAFVLHSCDNPACCNPAHLFLGNYEENMRDKVKKGRCPDLKGEKGPRAKLTNIEADEIRRLLSYGISCGELGRLFGVSKPVVQSIRTGRAYA